MKSTFQDLCNDIVIELFSYFNVHEMFYSFCLLIPCLPTLLKHGHVRLHVRSNNSYFIRWIVPHIRLTQVSSLDVFARPTNPSLFSFTNLRSLVLRDVDDPLLLFNRTNDWPPYYLERLSLHIRNQDIASKSSNVGVRVLEHAFQLPKLKHFELHESKSSLRMVELFDQLNFPSTFHSTTIEHLLITIYCHWPALQSILSYAPNLRQCQVQSSFGYGQTLSPNLCFPCIRKLTLQIDGLQTVILRGIFRNAPYLRCCTLHCSVCSFQQHHIDLLQSKTWLQLIENDTPQLKRLDLDIKFRLNDVTEQTVSTISEDLQNLNFHLSYCSDNGERFWKVTGVFNKI